MRVIVALLLTARLARAAPPEQAVAATGLPPQPALTTRAPGNVFDPDVYPAPRSAAPAGAYLHAWWTLSLGDAEVAVLIGTEGRLAMAPVP